MPELNGKVLVAQSGGPTAVINASLAGVIDEAGKHGEVEEIYGALNGILGVLNEDLIDLQEERGKTIEALKWTPAAALGTCRYKIDFKKKPEKAAADCNRILEVFKAHNIRYFFYIGGNDSQDTALRVHELAVQQGYDLRVIGVPKTIDNDLPHTDHCPGFGSVVKFNSTSIMEVGLDVSSMATDDGSVCILEVMGRATGWIAAGTVLAKRQPTDAPHIILLPEIPFNKKAFFARVQEEIARQKYCVVVVGEGLKDETGQELGADKSRLDAFGHPVLSGAAERLMEMLQGELNVKTRTVKFGYSQRAAAHFASKTDRDEAYEVGRTAVRAAIQGESGKMVKIVREQSAPYKWTTALHPLEEIANVEHFLPRDWISEDGFLPNEKFIEYAAPLIQGEVEVPTDAGLPKFARLEKHAVDKQLPPRS